MNTLTNVKNLGNSTFEVALPESYGAEGQNEVIRQLTNLMNSPEEFWVSTDSMLELYRPDEAGKCYGWFAANFMGNGFAIENSANTGYITLHHANQEIAALFAKMSEMVEMAGWGECPVEMFKAEN